MELRPHQRKAIEEMHNGCILGGGVGTGKTFTALSYYVLKVCGGSLDRELPMSDPCDVVVITTAKKRDELDWESEALHLGIFTDAELSYGGISITVDSWHNISKYADEVNKFFIFDEQRLVGSGKWVKAFHKIAKNNKWVLLSATPADTWLDYIPVFVANGFYRTRTDFLEQHAVWTFHGKYRTVRGFYGIKRLCALRDSILVDMPYDRHTTRHLIAVPCGFDKQKFDMVWKRRWNVYEDCPLIDVAEMYRVGRKVVNSDPDRLDKICELAEKHDRLIIYYNFDYELEDLRTLHSRLDIVVAEWNGKRHEPVPGTDRWLYLVQYAAGSEAWNCIKTNAIAYYSLNYSHRVFEQTQGRIDRLNTPFNDLYYYILMSDSQIDKRIWRSILTKKSFHEGRNHKF